MGTGASASDFATGRRSVAAAGVAAASELPAVGVATEGARGVAFCSGSAHPDAAKTVTAVAITVTRMLTLLALFRRTDAQVTSSPKCSERREKTFRPSPLV